MATPAWLAATANAATKAGQVNQFLGSHAAALVYAGTVQAQQVTAGSGSTSSNGLYIAQSFTTAAAQTTIGRVILTLAKTGTPPPISLSIQANVSGHPSGTPLVSTLIPPEFITGSAQTYPVPVTGLTASTTYWIVLNADGDASNFVSWSKSNQTSGASTSTNGTTWTPQTYGLLYQVFDGSLNTSFPPVHTWEDSGARWSLFGYSATQQATALWEYTAGQTATGYLASQRALTYTAGQLTSIT